MENEEAFSIYKCCLSYYYGDTAKNIFVKEFTVYKEVYATTGKLNKIVFGIYKPDYLIDSVYSILFENYLHTDTNSIDLSFLADNYPEIKIFTRKDDYKISKGKKYWHSKIWEKYKKGYAENGALIEFSKIVTSENHKYALVYMAVNTEVLGTGFLFLCMNENNKWKVRYNPILWVRASEWTN